MRSLRISIAVLRQASKSVLANYITLKPRTHLQWPLGWFADYSLQRQKQHFVLVYNLTDFKNVAETNLDFKKMSIYESPCRKPVQVILIFLISFLMHVFGDLPVHTVIFVRPRLGLGFRFQQFLGQTACQLQPPVQAIDHL